MCEIFSPLFLIVELSIILLGGLTGQLVNSFEPSDPHLDPPMLSATQRVTFNNN